MKSWENRHASYTCPTLMLFKRRKQILYWVMSVSHIAYDLGYHFDIRFAYLRCLSTCVLSWGLLWLRNFNVIVFYFVCLVLVWYLRISMLISENTWFTPCSCCLKMINGLSRNMILKNIRRLQWNSHNSDKMFLLPQKSALYRLWKKKHILLCSFFYDGSCNISIINNTFCTDFV